MEGGNRIGEYLRAQREHVRPEDVGLPDMGRRRVPGLRREELAMLAGISTDYYLRLEQGRDQHPSVQVLEALGAALQLDEHATAHLRELARPGPRRRRSSRRPEQVPDGVRQLVASWAGTPAFVQGRLMDVLTANRLATALSPLFATGVNLLRAVFLDQAVRDLHRDWDAATANAVAGLRTLMGPHLDDPELARLVGELSVRDERFRRLWARRDAKHRTRGVRHFDHPQVGPLELHFEELAISGAGGQSIVVFHAEPASASAQGLALLASIAAGGHEH